jgi:DNA-directed RNA polymerase subunit RPC12/RpoP
MAIAFKCLNCQQPYKVKDDMAGKKVVCTACKKPLRVPAPVASVPVSNADADALAVAALAEAPAPPAEEAASSITVECPNCMEEVTFPAEKAGKQAPCPSCKRIVKVPIPVTGKKDWRTADARPTFAKVVPEAELKGVVSTANMKIVDREAPRSPGGSRRLAKTRTRAGAAAGSCHPVDHARLPCRRGGGRCVVISRP